jgi:hypothetical protein
VETGFIYFRFRYHSPGHGRFVSRDRTYVDGLSLYMAYFVPNRMDPTGMLSFGAIVGGAKDLGGAIVGGAKDLGGAIVDGAKDLGSAGAGLLEKIGTALASAGVVISVEGDLKAEVNVCQGTIIGSANMRFFAGAKVGSAKFGLSKEFSGQLDPIRFDAPSCRNCECCRPGLAGIKLAGEYALLEENIKGLLKPIGVECNLEAEADLCETRLGVSCFANLMRYIPVVGPVVESLDALKGVKAQLGIEAAGEIGICNWPIVIGSDAVFSGAGKIAVALGED